MDWGAGYRLFPASSLGSFFFWHTDLVAHGMAVAGYQRDRPCGVGLGLWSQPLVALTLVGFEVPPSPSMPTVFEHQLCQASGSRMAQTLPGCFHPK